MEERIAKRRSGVGDVTGGESLLGGGVTMQRGAELLERIGAAGAASSLAGGLHGGQQQGHEPADDGDHDEQFDEREAASGRRGNPSENSRPMAIHHGGTSPDSPSLPNH